MPKAAGSNAFSSNPDTSADYSRRTGQAVIVVDASAILALLLNTTEASNIERRLVGASESLHAPHLIDLEITHVLRRYVSLGQLTPQQGERGLTEVADFQIIRYPHSPFLPRIWALRHNTTAYDAVYLALAESLPAPLITCGARLAAAAGHRATIELFGADSSEVP